MKSLRTPWMAVTAMFVLNGGLFGIWAARVPAVAEAYALSHGALGLVLLALAGGAVCAFPFAGRAVDRFGAAPVTRALALVYPVSLILLPVAPGAVALGFFLFLFGAVHGAMDVAMNAWAAEVERRGTRRVMAGFHAMFSLGAGIGALSGYLAVVAGLPLLQHFLFASVVLFAVTYPWARIDWTSDRAERRSDAIFAWPTGPLVLVGVVAFCSSLGEGAMADWSAVYLRDIGKVSEGTAALGYAVFSVAMVVMRLLGDRVTGAVGPVVAARWGGVSAFAGVCLAVLVPVPGAILAGFGLLGLGYAVIVPLAFSRAANDPAIPPGQAISSVATLGYGGMLLGPPVIGFVASLAGLQVAFGVMGVLAALIVVLARALR